MSEEIEKAIKSAATELASDPAHIPQIQWVMRKHLAPVKSQLTQERDDARLACAEKDEAIKTFCRTVNVADRYECSCCGMSVDQPHRDGCKVQFALSPTIGADLMRQLEALRLAASNAIPRMVELRRYYEERETSAFSYDFTKAIEGLQDAVNPKEPTE